MKQTYEDYEALEEDVNTTYRSIVTMIENIYSLLNTPTGHVMTRSAGLSVLVLLSDRLDIADGVDPTAISVGDPEVIKKMVQVYVDRHDQEEVTQCRARISTHDDGQMEIDVEARHE